MNIYELFPSPYVRAGDLPATGIIVTIKSVVIEDLRNNKTKKIERKPVMYFHKAKKGMVLNKTNGFIIAGLYGPDMDGWPGQRIELYPTRVEAFGTMQDAIRVRERRYEAQAAQSVEHAPILESQEDVLDHEPDDEDVDGDFRAVDADTGEITYRAPAPPVQPAVDGDVLFDRNTPWYADARNNTTNGVRKLCDTTLELHRTGGPASSKQYGWLCGLIDGIVEQATGAEDAHKRVLPVLCQAEISGANPPSAALASKMLDRLATHIKNDAGEKVENPEYSKPVADAMIAIYRAAEAVGTPSLLEPA